MHVQSWTGVANHPSEVGLSPEARLLLLSAGGVESAPAMRCILEEPLDWVRLLELGVAEGAHPALGKVLRAAIADPIPTEAAPLWSSVERVAGFRMAYLGRRMEETLAILTGAGMRVIILKGAAMALTTHGSFVERPMSDIDLLLYSEHLLEARRLMLESGWSAAALTPADEKRFVGKHHLPPLLDAQARRLEVGLELHADLFNPSRSPFSLSREEIWNSAVPVERLGAGVFVPDPCHALLHCCIHFSWSHTMRKGTWRTFRDIAGVCRRGGLDWERFVAVARECGGASSCYWSLRLARKLGGAAVPESVLAALAPSGPATLLAALEHHLAQDALESERRCPSGRLRRAMWSAAVRPRTSGHGRRRPWTGQPSIDDEEAGPSITDDPSCPNALSRVRSWSCYLTALTRAGLSGDRTSSSRTPLPRSTSTPLPGLDSEKRM